MSQPHSSTRRPTLVAVALLAALAPVACSESPAEPTPEPSGASPSAAASPAVPTAAEPTPAARDVDDCELVSQAEVEAALGITVAEVVPDPLDISNGCSYRTADYSAGGGSYDISSYAPAGVLLTQVGGILLIPSLEPGTFADELTGLAESAYANLGG